MNKKELIMMINQQDNRVVKKMNTMRVETIQQQNNAYLVGEDRAAQSIFDIMCLLYPEFFNNQQNQAILEEHMWDLIQALIDNDLKYILLFASHPEDKECTDRIIAQNITIELNQDSRKVQKSISVNNAIIQYHNQQFSDNRRVMTQ